MLQGRAGAPTLEEAAGVGPAVRSVRPGGEASTVCRASHGPSEVCVVSHFLGLGLCPQCLEVDGWGTQRNLPHFTHTLAHWHAHSQVLGRAVVEQRVLGWRERSRPLSQMHREWGFSWPVPTSSHIMHPQGPRMPPPHTRRLGLGMVSWEDRVFAAPQEGAQCHLQMS